MGAAMYEDVISKIVRELRAEADIDFFDVSFIAEGLREDLHLRDQSEIRRHTLEVIRRLMQQGVYPGDYTLSDLEGGSSFQFKAGTPEELLSWIETEWIAMGRTPTFEDPIWFALRKEVCS